jgi:hypothetical protein
VQTAVLPNLRALPLAETIGSLQHLQRNPEADLYGYTWFQQEQFARDTEATFHQQSAKV